MHSVTIGCLGSEGAVVVEFKWVGTIIGGGTMDLVGQPRDAWHGLARFGFGDRHFARGRLSFRKPSGGLVGQQPARLKITVHLNTVMLNRLETANRASELDPRFSV